MNHTKNIQIFRDTEKLCKTNPTLLSATNRAIAGQKMIPEAETLPGLIYNRYADDARVAVSSRRSLEAARRYKGQRTAVLNFASATNPGGGVVRGASAQEECLCRCSNLYFCLNTPKMWDAFYSPHRSASDPIHNDDIIFTPDVAVFKTDTEDPELMAEKDWYAVDVITCAAPNLRQRPGNPYNSGDGDKRAFLEDDQLLALHEKRLKRILDAALLQNVESVILGAFGCGAFSNDPEIVARAAGNVIAGYLKAFRNIEFAVYCSPRDQRNYTIFERVLKPLTG
ncbi:MAG: TIGR02452 family protein [Roseburia sp.]|nr:TIGR02452 family protein [Roseburia sp.]MCM1097648.1 TIGR02452 family protein [Ruminococcus flavefaciens]